MIERLKNTEIISLSDVHITSPQCSRLKVLLKLIEQSKDLPNLKHFVLNGDIFDFALNVPQHFQKYDLVVMNKGLCLCQGSYTCCGGINLNSQSELSFFLTQTKDLLNPKVINQSGYNFRTGSS